MRTSRFLAVGSVCLVLTLIAFAAWAAPPYVSYQGQLLDQATGDPLNGTFDMEFRVYDAASGGTYLWSQTHTDVYIKDGVFNVTLGPVNPDDFLLDNRWIEVWVEGEPFSPRQQCTSVLFAINADRLDGLDSGDFAQSGHGHSGADITSGIVADARIAASIARDSEITWGNLASKPAGFADNVDDTGITTETDPTVLASVKNGVSWGEVTSKPAGFADNVDNDSGGTITGVTAGTGITGGGSSGNVPVSLQVPINLEGDHTNGIIRGRHTTNDNFARLGSAWEGVFGSSDSGRGVVGWSEGNDGVRGVNTYSNNYGVLGSLVYGVYGNSSIAAVYGENTNGNIGYLAGLGAGVYGEGVDNYFAGYFDGKVKVAGRATVEILQITGGSDLSEQFDIEKLDEDIEPGMLVSIDPERPGKLTISKEPYDNKVAGVISGAGGIKPGMLMAHEGTEADGAHPVALTGRVFCWGDASQGAIKPGDLLTTSDVPGHAMKVKDHQRALGAIIGKAMTSLEKGRGLVLVLVSLQ